MVLRDYLCGRVESFFPHPLQIGDHFCTYAILVTNLQSIPMSHIGDDPVSTEREALQTPEEARGLEEDLARERNRMPQILRAPPSLSPPQTRWLQ